MGKTIYFFASFGDFNTIPAGGGQTSARRLLATLQKLGYNVIVINRNRPNRKSGIVRNIHVLWGLATDPLRFAFRLMFKKRKDSAVLFISYAGALIPFEFLITSVGRLLGFEVVMFLKGGGTKRLYQEGSNGYKWLFGRTMRNCYEIMLEGKENIELVKETSETKTYYLPNYTEDCFAPDVLPKKPKDRINIVYFGRIDQTKNVLLSIEIFDLLCEKYQNLYYTIVGGGNPDYESLVIKRITSSLYKNRITKLPRSNHDTLKHILKTQHFFLFPSNEPREGHSNALNEAMSWGVVPIVSTNNFLPSIVGDERLVSKSFQADEYVKRISCIIDNVEIEELSQKMYYKVKNEFTQSEIEKKLKMEFDKILNK